jgi:hypothetical protein
MVSDGFMTKGSFKIIFLFKESISEAKTKVSPSTVATTE